MITNKVEKIYHYTSIEAACKIIDSGIMRATNIMYQNDSSEMLQSHKIIKEYLLKSIREDNNENIVTKILKSFEWYEKNTFPIFTLSFSTKQDDLNQWRVYGNDGKGCCLCFKLDNLKEKFEPVNSESMDKIDKKCIYENDEIKHCLSKLKRKLFLKGENYIPDIAERMKIEIFSNAPFIKHNAYKDESEYRIAFYSEDDNISIKCNEKGNPFIEIKTNNCYDSIFFGPRASGQDIEKLKYWLNKKSIKIQSEKSLIPYRGN